MSVGFEEEASNKSAWSRVRDDSLLCLYFSDGDIYSGNGNFCGPRARGQHEKKVAQHGDNTANAMSESSKRQKLTADDSPEPEGQALLASGGSGLPPSLPLDEGPRSSRMDCDADTFEDTGTSSAWQPQGSGDEDMQVEKEDMLEERETMRPENENANNTQTCEHWLTSCDLTVRDVPHSSDAMKTGKEGEKIASSRMSPRSPIDRPHHLFVRSSSDPVPGTNYSSSEAAASPMAVATRELRQEAADGYLDSWRSAPNSPGMTNQNFHSNRFETEHTISNPYGLSDYSRAAIKMATEAGISVAESIEAFIESPCQLQPQPHFITGNIEEETVTTHLIKGGHTDAVLQLLRFGADPNKLNMKNNTPISVAANKGMVDITRHLISHGANVSVENGSGSTALIQAAHFGHYDCVRLLLANGANADFINKKGTTALMRASQEGYMNICHALIMAGANVRRRNKEGMNALMLASQRGHAAMAILLMKAGAVLDNETAQGSTALMLASKRGNKDCIEELIRMGAEMHILDDRGRSARDHATKKTHMALLPVLDTQTQVKKMRSSIRAMRNNMLMAILFSHSKFDLRLGLEEQYARALVHYLKTWRQRAAQAQDAASAGAPAPKLDLLHLGAEVQPSLAYLYPDGTMTPAEREAVQYKAVVSVLRSLDRDEQELPLPEDGPARVCVPGTYTDLRRQLGLHYLTPTESRAMLERSDTADALYGRALRLQKRKRGISDHMWGMFWARCMQRIPMDCIILIIGYIPAPRIWNWTLRKMKTRMHVVGSQFSCTVDLLTVVDEIFTDSQLFAVSSLQSGTSSLVQQASSSAARSNAAPVPLGPRGQPIEFIGAPVEPIVDINEAHMLATGPKEMDLSDSQSVYNDTVHYNESTDSSAEECGSEVGADGCKKVAIDNSPAAQRQRINDAFREQHKQRAVLVHIARSPHIQKYLVEHCDMPVAIMQACVYWSGLQLAVTEYSPGGTGGGAVAADGTPPMWDSYQDVSLSVKEPCVRRLYLFVKALYKWYQHRHSAASMLEMPPVPYPHPFEPTRHKPAVVTREPPLCLCNLPSVCVGKMGEGPQAGRVYYACGQEAVNDGGSGDKSACMFFQWASESAHTGGPPQVKYSPFLPPSWSPQDDLSEAHYSKRNIGLINEGTGTCVNHLVESALMKPPKSHGTAGANIMLTRRLVSTATGAFDRGMPGIAYDDEIDSDDTDDSTYNRRHAVSGTHVAEDTDEDFAGGDQEEEEGDSDSDAPHTIHTEATSLPGIPNGIPHGVPYLNQGL